MRGSCEGGSGVVGAVRDGCEKLNGERRMVSLRRGEVRSWWIFGDVTDQITMILGDI